MTSQPRTAPPIANRLELPIGEGVALRVDFDRANDRWQHRVFLVVPKDCDMVGPVLLLESVEGTSEEDWPISPPLQFVSIETRPKKLPVALLMGMSGDGHWSASIEQLAADLTLRFDIACRAKSRPENLGSRYRLGPRVESRQHADRIQLRVGPVGIEIAGEVAPDSPQPGLELQERDFHVQFSQPVGDDAQTYRWIYRLQAIHAARG